MLLLKYRILILAHLVSLKKPIISASIDKVILTIIFAIALILLGTTKSSAILQANPTTHKSPSAKNGATWITEIRQMETANQTMGLNETLNGLNATSANNGIDVHMILPTEYGAVAILSASGYGNPKKLLDETDAQKRTTTGNSTGVYFTGDRYEHTASHPEGKYGHCDVNEVGSITSFIEQNGWHGGEYSGSTIFGTTSVTNTPVNTNMIHLIAGGSGIFRCGFWRDKNYDTWSLTRFYIACRRSSSSNIIKRLFKF